jgi:hypothetical protein
MNRWSAGVPEYWSNDKDCYPKKRECSFAQRKMPVFPHCGPGNRSIDSIEVFRPGKGGEMVQELDLKKFRTLLMNKRNQILDYRAGWGGT